MASGWGRPAGAEGSYSREAARAGYTPQYPAGCTPLTPSDQRERGEERGGGEEKRRGGQETEEGRGEGRGEEKEEKRRKEQKGEQRIGRRGRGKKERQSNEEGEGSQSGEKIVVWRKKTRN